MKGNTRLQAEAGISIPSHPTLHAQQRNGGAERPHDGMGSHLASGNSRRVEGWKDFLDPTTVPRSQKSCKCGLRGIKIGGSVGMEQPQRAGRLTLLSPSSIGCPPPLPLPYPSLPHPWPPVLLAPSSQQASECHLLFPTRKGKGREGVQGKARFAKKGINGWFDWWCVHSSSRFVRGGMKALGSQRKSCGGPGRPLIRRLGPAHSQRPEASSLLRPSGMIRL